MTDWLRNIPLYHNLNEIDAAMRVAIKEDGEDYAMDERDYVLAGMVSYLALNYVSPLVREYVLQTLDLYCGKPLEKGSDTHG